MPIKRGLSGVALSAAALALATGGIGLPTTAPTPNVPAVRQAESHGVVPAATAPATSNVTAPHAALLGYTRDFRRGSAIWYGVQKRGNRRGRSRHDYRR